jgi:hypothetical protein
MNTADLAALRCGGHETTQCSLSDYNPIGCLASKPRGGR